MAKNKKVTLSLNRIYEAMLSELMEECKRKTEFPDSVTEEAFLKDLIYEKYFSTVGSDDDPDEWFKKFYERI